LLAQRRAGRGVPERTPAPSRESGIAFGLIGSARGPAAFDQPPKIFTALLFPKP
jgi:hypothetical protein